MATQKKAIFSKILKITIMSLLIILTATILIGWIAGYKAFIVNGGSMEPIIEYRSLAVDYKLDANDIQIGDAVT